MTSQYFNIIKTTLKLLLNFYLVNQFILFDVVPLSLFEKRTHIVGYNNVLLYPTCEVALSVVSSVPFNHSEIGGKCGDHHVDLLCIDQ